MKIVYRVWNKKEKVYCLEEFGITKSGGLDYGRDTDEILMPYMCRISDSYKQNLEVEYGLQLDENTCWYENDILELKHTEMPSEYDGFAGVVKFIEGGFWVVNDELRVSIPLWRECDNGWSLVSNVHFKGEQK